MARLARDSLRRAIKRLWCSDWVKLAPILGLAFYIAYIPHANYRFPLHVDEWVHLANARAIVQAQDLRYPEPTTGGAVLTPRSNLEVGFHLFLGTFRSISGISWLSIFRYLPAVISMVMVLSVYAFARRQGFGWEAAFLTAFIPTTAGILGPALLVPVSLGLTFAALSLFVVFHFRGWQPSLVLLLLSAFLFLAHAVSAIAIALILVPFIIITLTRDLRYGLAITAAMVAPAIAFQGVSSQLMPTLKELFAPAYLPSHVQWPLIIQLYGYLPLALWLVGVMALAIKGGSKNHGLVLGLLALSLMLFVFIGLHRGVLILFWRGLLFVMLMMGIVGGAGLVAIKRLRLPEKVAGLRMPRYAGPAMCLAVVIAVLVTVVPVRQNAGYYHMIDEEDYQAFAWIEKNVPPTYSKAIVDPWKGTAFAAITSKKVHTLIHSYPTSGTDQAYRFLKGGAVDTAFLKANGISIVYSREPAKNPDLVQVRKNVYLLK